MSSMSELKILMKKIDMKLETEAKSREIGSSEKKDKKDKAKKILREIFEESSE